jgi:hypothetical protein
MSDANVATVPRVTWMRVIAGGVLWAAVYNLVWGVAWFLFMRREWREALAAIDRPMVWTTDVWIGWIALTLPIGVAIVAYTANSARSGSASKAAVYSGATLWLLMTVGMTIWGWQDSLSIRILALDAMVNLVAMLSASLAGTWSHGHRGAPET